MAAATTLHCRIGEIIIADAVWRSRPITVPKFVKNCRSVTEILHFFKFLRWLETHLRAKFRQNRSFRCGYIAIFRIFKMAAAAILDFRNREILLVIRVQRLETHLHAKFCQNRSIGCEDIRFFDFSRWRPSTILDSFGVYLDHPQ